MSGAFLDLWVKELFWNPLFFLIARAVLIRTRYFVGHLLTVFTDDENEYDNVIHNDN